MKDDVELQPADPHSEKGLASALNKGRITTFVRFNVKKEVCWLVSAGKSWCAQMRNFEEILIKGLFIKL